MLFGNTGGTLREHSDPPRFSTYSKIYVYSEKLVQIHKLNNVLLRESFFEDDG